MHYPISVSHLEPTHLYLMLPGLHDCTALRSMDRPNRVARAQLAESHAGLREPLQALGREQPETGLRDQQPPLLEDIEEGRELGPVLDDIESRGREEVRVPANVNDLVGTGSDVVHDEGVSLSRNQDDLAGVRRQVGPTLGSSEARRVDPILRRPTGHRYFEPEAPDLDHVVRGRPREVRDVGLPEAECVRVNARQNLESAVEGLHLLGRRWIA